jgi:hypothetical protein
MVETTFWAVGTTNSICAPGNRMRTLLLMRPPCEIIKREETVRVPEIFAKNGHKMETTHKPDTQHAHNTHNTHNTHTHTHTHNITFKRPAPEIVRGADTTKLPATLNAAVIELGAAKTTVPRTHVLFKPISTRPTTWLAGPGAINWIAYVELVGAQRELNMESCEVGSWSKLGPGNKPLPVTKVKNSLFALAVATFAQVCTPAVVELNTEGETNAPENRASFTTAPEKKQELGDAETGRITIVVMFRVNVLEPWKTPPPPTVT